MANENYRQLLKDIHVVRRIRDIPEVHEGKFADIETYLDYLADNEYNLAWVEVRPDKLFPYETRTLVKLLEENSLNKNFSYFSIQSLKQYLCPCCQAMTRIDLEISGKPFELTVTYLPPNWRSDVQRFIGKNLTLQQMLDFPSVDQSAELKEIV